MKLTQCFEEAGAWVVRKRKPVLVFSALLLLVSAALITRLGVETDIAALLPAHNPVAQRFTQITDDFETTSVLIAVIGGPDREHLVAAARAWEQALRTDEETGPLIRSIQSETDTEFLESWGLLLQEDEDLTDNERLFRSTRLLPLIRNTNDLLEEKLAEGMDEDIESSGGDRETVHVMTRFTLFSRYLARALQENPENHIDDLVDSWRFGETFMVDAEEKTLLLLVRPNFTLGDRDKLYRLSEGARRIARETTANLEGSGYSGITFAFTGDVENEADEERAISSDIFYPSILAFILIAGLFLVSMRRKRSIVFALLALAAGILVDLAFAAVTVQKLNMITSSFGALLVGLGIDFGIHLVSRFDEEHSSGKNPEQAIRSVFGHVASPILIGGLTTSIAFFSLMLSRTSAFRQFGLVSGMGILTTLCSSFILLPALLSTFPGKQADSPKLPLLSYSGLNRLVAKTQRIPALTVGIFLAVAVFAAFFVSGNSFEYDMRQIGPQNTAAKKAEELVGARFGVSTWQHMASAKTLEEVRTLADTIADAPLVKRVESIADYVPPAEEQTLRLAVIERIKSQTGRSMLPGGTSSTLHSYWNEERATELSDEFQRLEWNMIELGDLCAALLGEDSLPVRKRNAMIRETFGNETGREGEEVFLRVRQHLDAIIHNKDYGKLETLDAAFSIQLDEAITRMSGIERPITLHDVPADIRNDFVTPDETHFLAVIFADPALASGDSFVRFADGLRETTDKATGTLVLGVELSREILAEACRVALIVLIIVILFVALSLRSIFMTLVCMIPLLSGMVWMFAVYPLFGKFNIVNVLSLPLIIGTGIDYCVHIGTSFNPAEPESDSFRKTLKAVTMSALTTAMGFGSLALAGQFQGIADLGTTLFIGIGCSYLAAVFMIPAMVLLGKKFVRKESL